MKVKYVGKRLLLITTSLLLNACSMGAGHIPPAMVILSPVVKVSNSISKSHHNYEIKKIKKYISINYSAVRKETYQGNGEHLERLILLIKNRNEVAIFKKKLQQEYELLFNNSKDVVMMIDSNVIKRFVPHQTRLRLLAEIQNDYNGLRLAIKNKDISRLGNIVEILSITQDEKEGFYSRLFQQYDSIFIEPVSIRVHRILKMK